MTNANIKRGFRMSIERYNLEQEKKLRIRKILTNLLNSVSYKSKERDSLITVATVDIMLKDSKKLWLADLEEFLEKNSRVCIKTYGKYYFKDLYEKMYNPIYLSDYKADLDLFAETVRRFKDITKSTLVTQKSLKSYFLKKKRKKVKI